MSPFILIPLVSLVCVCGLMAGIWVWATSIKNAGIVDIFWAFDFAIIAIIIWFLANGEVMRKNIVCSLTILWSFRLGGYLLKRIGSHLDDEEGRYKQLRIEWAPHVNLKFFIFFQMQAISNVFLCIPFFITALNPDPEFSMLEYIGAAMWLLSIIGEAVADWQLQQFKKNPLNKGKVCEYGLWNYSRHPNYFFQLMIWISVFIFSISSPYGWIAIICPLAIGYLIFKVTGIPMTEEQAIRSKGDLYKEYQKTTSIFVPWFKKA